MSKNTLVSWEYYLITVGEIPQIHESFMRHDAFSLTVRCMKPVWIIFYYFRSNQERSFRWLNCNYSFTLFGCDKRGHTLTVWLFVEKYHHSHLMSWQNSVSVSNIVPFISIEFHEFVCYKFQHLVTYGISPRSVFQIQLQIIILYATHKLCVSNLEFNFRRPKLIHRCWLHQ